MGQIDGSLRPVQAVLTAASGSQAFLLQFLIQIIVILGRRRGPGVPAETTGIIGLCLSVSPLHEFSLHAKSHHYS